MLNGGPVSCYSKKQVTVAFSLTKAEYVVLTLIAKETTWLRLLLIEIGLLNKDGQYAEIKVAKSTRTEQIKDNTLGQEEKVSSRILTSIAILAAPANLSTSLSLKDDNQGSIALVHNLVFHAQTKHIDIQNHYICDKVTIRKIDL